jgi:hypothetical protein
MFRPRHASVWEIEGVELRWVEARVILWLNPGRHGRVADVVVLECQERSFKLLQVKI